MMKLSYIMMLPPPNFTVIMVSSGGDLSLNKACIITSKEFGFGLIGPDDVLPVFLRVVQMCWNL